MVNVSRIDSFVSEWTGRGNEKQETHKFWIELLNETLGVCRTQDIDFEHRTAMGGYIDVFCADARFLVEMKSATVNLDEPEERQKKMVTPVEQALRYANTLPASEKPSYICTCNFSEFRFYDLNADPMARKPSVAFPLSELADNVGVFETIFSYENSRLHQQEKASEDASIRVARLHDALASQYPNPDDPEAHHALAMLTVRIVFCLYAEDSGLFQTGQFTRLIESVDNADWLGQVLSSLFAVLDMPEDDARRLSMPSSVREFPYVDGGLFRDAIIAPPFTDDIRTALIDAGRDFNWSQISPVVFGSLMEETLSHDQRRRGGMHYTSVEAIHRVIDPLFLNELTDELDDLLHSSLGERALRNRLTAYQDKLASLNFLDPACGSGNFLTETYIQLRRLEDRTLSAINHNQGMIDLAGTQAGSLVKVSIKQFHGIEINDFAACVARTALWIAEQQALDKTESIAGCALPHLPLQDAGNIVCANALRIDWNDVLPCAQCDYIMGNPPFLGRNKKSDEQTDDMKSIWQDGYDGNLDYSTAWYKKSADYLTNKQDASFAFVSTNSIAQGQPVSYLFKPLMAAGWRISFAHQTFNWNVKTTDTAHVHVVIVGMDRKSDAVSAPVLYSYDDINGEPDKYSVSHINPYLIDAPTIFIDRRQHPLSRLLPEVIMGSMPRDGGHFMIDTVDEYNAAMGDPIAAKYVRPFRMGRELVRGLDRWCLWLKDAPGSDLMKSPFIRKRLEAVREFRLASNAKSTQDWADRAQLFVQENQPDTAYVGIPKVVSGNRPWFTVARLDSNVIAGDMVYTCPDPDGFMFAIISSSMFVAWQQAVGGKLKSDYRFSNTLVWNNLPLSDDMSDALREQIIAAGRDIIAVRDKYEGESLASLYTPLGMHPDLLKAHRHLDSLVDIAFGAGKPCKSNDERLTVLFNAYERLTA